MTYQWKVPIPKVDAQIAGEELERISREVGTLRPEQIVDASRDEKAVLHGCFEWDDAAAAEGYRKSQAQDILRNIVTVDVCGEESKAPVRAFVNIRNEYIPIMDVIVSVDYSSEMLAAALKELRSFKQKYSTLSKLSGVFVAIEQLEGEDGRGA